MSVNDIQIDGTHYKNKRYQHWDFACDTEQPYVIGCATKYIARWKHKHPEPCKKLIDLEKSIHYLQKAKEKCILVKLHDTIQYTEKFVSQLEVDEAFIIGIIMQNKFDEAVHYIEKMIIKYKSVLGEATAAYVDQ